MGTRMVARERTAGRRRSIEALRSYRADRFSRQLIEQAYRQV
jgi:hypothetical protein